ncbi:hypothetical protein MPSEU_000208200 [Mayamaea pseudoterrestris]|nr:hypothetical protein MPSEU_000208200 [Mayamaea pseudoterrestris]
MKYRRTGPYHCRAGKAKACRLLFLLLALSFCWHLHLTLAAADDETAAFDYDETIVEDEDGEGEDYWTATELLRYEVGIDYMAIHDDESPTTPLHLNSNDAHEAARQVINIMTTNFQERIARLFTKAKTPECRAKIAEHFTYFVNAIGKEQALPFSDVTFPNTCPEPVYDWDNLPEGMHIGMVQNRSYQPPRNNETEHLYIGNPNELKLLYAILTHDSPESTIRLIGQLYEPGHVFVIHVDGKEGSDDTYRRLVEYASTREYVHVLGEERRVRINWGGFSMVNATLQVLKYAFAVDEPDRKALEFDKFYHVASTSYPLASNSEIRRKLASFPLDANFVYTIMKQTRPAPSVWHYFVECDDALHRIHRLPPLQNATHGVEMYTSSQWFIISREFAEHLAKPPPGSFAYEYLDYIEHVVVADETFFGTVLRHSEYCTKHHNNNFLHLQFDRWESDLPAGQRDERKCMMLDPNHCGRSPTTMTIDYVDILELSDELFARKFDDSAPDNAKVKDIIDEWRSRHDQAATKTANFDRSLHQVHVNFAGHGVLIVAKETVNDAVPLCLGLGSTGNRPKLVPCFHDAVIPSLEEEWETGAVILEETPWHNRWSVGPCTSDGSLERLSKQAIMNVTAGLYSATGPRCQLKQVDGQRSGRCFDAESGKSQPGGKTQVFPCTDKWYQFVAFGDGVRAPVGSMYTKVPSHIVKQINNLGKQQHQFLCLGVAGRGAQDEADWEAIVDGAQTETVAASETNSSSELKPLSEWHEREVITTQCTNTGAVIEWLFVPFIVEEEERLEASPSEGDADLINDSESNGDDTTSVSTFAGLNEL